MRLWMLYREITLIQTNLQLPFDIFNGKPFVDIYYSKYHWDTIIPSTSVMVLGGISGSQWYTVRLFVIIQNTIQTWSILNGTSSSQWYTFVYFLPFKIPLRPTNLPLTSSMKRNGIERYWKVYRWPNLISKLTIEVLNGTGRYLLQVFNGIPFVDFLQFKVPLRPTNLPLMSPMVLNGTERYWTVLNGIEWYWMVLTGIPLAGFYKGCTVVLAAEGYRWPASTVMICATVAYVWRTSNYLCIFSEQRTPLE